MKTLFKARKVSKQLIELLSPGPYKVHSRFSHGINIDLGGWLSFMGVGNSIIPPLGLVVEKNIDNDFTTFKDDYIFWNDKLNIFESNNLIVDLSSSNIVDSSLIVDPTSIHLDNLAILLRLVDKNIMMGFGNSIGDLMDLDMDIIRELSSVFYSSSSFDIENTLRKWIGRGIGLTPTGDDFLQGILYINQLTPILGKEFIKVLTRLILSGNLTTDISINYYKCALKNMYSSTLIDLSKALKSGNQKIITSYIDELLELGNTSGRDILSGILTGISFAINKKRNNN